MLGRWVCQAGGLLQRQWVVVLAVLLASCHRSTPDLFDQLDHARATTAELRAQLSRADAASNRAVMADTDQASLDFARDAEREAAQVEANLSRLGQSLERLGFADELGALGGLRQKWRAYQRLDQQILALAVQNTNLKAQRLAFGPAQEAADALGASLERLAQSETGQTRCAAAAQVAVATLAVREIQVLQARHIAEHSDAVMTELEEQLHAREKHASEALSRLEQLAPKSAQSDLTKAADAWRSFSQRTSEILALSRRNTNLRSLELALVDKPPLSLACDRALAGLQKALAERVSRATR
jgi:hypothetical protein